MAREGRNRVGEQVLETIRDVQVAVFLITSRALKFPTALERSRSASILSRSVRFRVSEQGPIKRCQRGEWLGLRVRSADKVFP